MGLPGVVGHQGDGVEGGLWCWWLLLLLLLLPLLHAISSAEVPLLEA
jgi:hypothetical protein